MEKQVQEMLYEAYQLAQQSKTELSKECSMGSEILDTVNRMDRIMKIMKELAHEEF